MSCVAWGRRRFEVFLIDFFDSGEWRLRKADVLPDVICGRSRGSRRSATVRAIASLFRHVALAELARVGSLCADLCLVFSAGLTRFWPVRRPVRRTGLVQTNQRSRYEEGIAFGAFRESSHVTPFVGAANHYIPIASGLATKIYL